MTESIRTLRSGFLHSSEAFPERPALEVRGEVFTFRTLRKQAASLAATLSRRSPSNDPPLTAVFAYRSPTAFAGVLGVLFRGHGYVPLNRRFPPARNRVMLERAGCRAVIVDAESEEQLEHVLEDVKRPLLLILPERGEVKPVADRWPLHTILGAADLEPAEAWKPEPVSPDSIAYLLFTSGSTGTPKGVMVAHRNVLSFIDVIVDRYGITKEDRFSQVFDLTFDLSVFDMFVSWECGACVCCPSQKALIKPDKFIRDSRLTVWFSVPSTGVLMKRLGMLKPDRYLTLRWILFCGEALPGEIATAWAQAAPQAIVENLYGPTELTIACMVYRWDRQTSAEECVRGIVPIGRPYPGMKAFVADETLMELPPGSEGELLVAGAQLTLGYWQDPERTAVSFVVPPGKSAVYYRTGDRVCSPRGGGSIVYLGRSDQQVKISGYRVELGEVEAVLCEEARVEVAVALAWPLTASGAAGIVAFLDTIQVDVEKVRARLQTRLPNYMVPHEFRVLSEFPLNGNGKVDRRALLRILEASS